MTAFCPRAFGRILWREAAQQYAFCIAIFAMVVVIQAGVTTMSAFQLCQPPSVEMGFGIALFMTAIYAAACSALLFTADVDAGTFAFHRTRPLGWSSYLSGKLVWVFLSTALLGAGLWVEAGCWLTVFPNFYQAAFVFRVYGVAIVEGIAWGLIATLTIRGPLRAVVAALAFGSYAVWKLAVVYHRAFIGGSVWVTTAYSNAAGVRLAVALVVLAVGVILARTWYRTGQPLGRAMFARWLYMRSSNAVSLGQWSIFPTPRPGRATRLLWQTWGARRSPILLYWGGCFAVAVWVYSHYRALIDKIDSVEHLLTDCVMLMAIAFVAFSSILAGYTFGPDQKAQFLQLARDGVSPKEIWLSRVGLMAMVLLPPAIVLFGLLHHLFGLGNDTLFLRPLALLLVLLGYCSVLIIGQACSMFFPSRTIALLVSPMLILCFAIWIGMGVFWAGLGWKLGAAPLLLALLIAGRLLVGTRLRQDHSWRAMRVPGLLVGAAAFFSYQAFAYHRAHEIRPYDGSREQLSEQINSLRYIQDLFPPMETATSPREWLEEQLTTAATVTPSTERGIAKLWRDNASPDRRSSPMPLLVDYDESLMREAELDRVLREVIVQSEVTNDRLRDCVAFLTNWSGMRSHRSAWMEAALVRDLVWLRQGPIERRFADYGFHDEPLPTRYRWFGFERSRMLRILTRVCVIASERSDGYETALIDDSPNLSPYPSTWVTSGDVRPYDPTRPMWYQTAEEPLEYSRETPFFVLGAARWQSWGAEHSLYQAESHRRATILFIALKMYYDDHGELPGTLSKLVDDRYLDRLPVVPLLLVPFGYHPTGASTLPPSSQEAEDGDFGALGSYVEDENHGPRVYGSWSFYFTSNNRHDESAPYLWYPLEATPCPDGSPDTVPRWYFDLQFVKQGGDLKTRDPRARAPEGTPLPSPDSQPSREES